ncbi:hypothetical protein HGRIS_010251 [Hohenbuehelia grisea]|uniref:Teneurin-like YD-shell domain-containing protein n=1 Tax=Hohenbuehelia grisea TaxID=104357 RepID=A0ABR3J438_9AGAR
MQNGATVKERRLEYYPGSSQVQSTSQWIGADTYSTQSFEFDKTGNDIVIKGPGSALMKLAYDDTYSNVTSSSTYVAEGAAPLTETAEFDLATGKPVSSTGANGNTTKLVYDVLVRVVETSLGDEASTTTIDTQAYEVIDNQFYQTTYTDFGGDKVQFKTINHIDGLSRVWKTEAPRPDDLDEMICSDIQYDGAGRMVARSRDYPSTATPAVTTFKYDALSRAIEQSVPAVAVGVAPVTITTAYTYDSGVLKVTDTKSQADNTPSVTSRCLTYLPNPEPSTDKLVVPYGTSTTDELQQTIQTAFDPLGRPSCIQDPSGAKLSLIWDGLGRVISRRVTHVVKGVSKDISYTTALYDSANTKLTAENQLTGSKTVTTMDWAQRPVSKVTADETLAFVYDEGGQYTKERLVSVTSSNNIKHTFDYDIRGNITMSNIKIDDQDYRTTYQWSLANELLQTVNPDGSTITRSLLADGQTVGNLELANAANVARASVSLSNYADGFARPLLCEFGNGLTSNSVLTSNGMIATMNLSKGNTTVHTQNWKIDAFSRITSYDVSSPGLLANSGASNSFLYDAAGQLDKHQSQGSSSAHEFSYDESGNLLNRNGKAFINDGWQLSQIKNSDDTVEFSFKYSDDGLMTSKLDGLGTVLKTMQYDANGRLALTDQMSFVYDFSGNLLKATMANGDVRLYINQAYEIDIPKSGSASHTAYLVHGYRRAALQTTDGSSADVVHYFHADHLGSTIAVSDDTGAIITQYSYDSFGKATVTQGQDVSRYKFSGKEAFGDLYYYGARFYEPDIGRFLTLDNYPVSIEGLKTSTFNMYTFSRNDPVNYIDLNGNAPWWHWFVDAVLITVGVALSFVPGVNAVVLGVVTGALIGAGVSGASYDISGKSDNKEWGLQVGLGGLIGGISGGASTYLDAILPAVTISDPLAAEGAIGLRTIGGYVVRTTIRIAVHSELQSGLSVLQQVIENAVHGDPLDKDLGQAAATGAIGGALSSLKQVPIKFGKPLIRSDVRFKLQLTMRARAANQLFRTEKWTELGSITKNIENPLRQTFSNVARPSEVAVSNTSSRRLILFRDSSL